MDDLSHRLMVLSGTIPATLPDTFDDVPILPSRERDSNATTALVSSLPCDVMPLLDVIADAQADDKELDDFVSKEHVKLIPESRLVDGRKVWGDVSTAIFRPLVPAAARKAVFDQLHGQGHFGVKRTRKMINTRFVWPTLGKSINKWTKECETCGKAKPRQGYTVPLHSHPPPTGRFDDIHVDIVGPFKPSNGFSHLFTIMDRFTRWPAAVPIRNTTAAECTSALWHGWVQTYGVPKTILSDRGSEFVSDVWMQMGHIAGIRISQTTAYHPQANGVLERWHSTLKTAIRARIIAAGGDWYSALPLVMLGLRAGPNSLGSSPAALTFTQDLTLPGQLLPDGQPASEVSGFAKDFRDQMSRLSFPATEWHVKDNRNQDDNNEDDPDMVRTRSIPTPLADSEWVYVRNDNARSKMEEKFKGPFRVKQKRDTFFIVRFPSGDDTVAIERLKPALKPESEPTIGERRWRKTKWSPVASARSI